MKHEIKIGDKVSVLYCNHLQVGICKRINSKSITVILTFLQSDCTWKEFDFRAKKDRVAHIEDEFTVIWKTGICDGSYRIDYDSYPKQNKPYTSWNTWNYIVE